MIIVFLMSFERMGYYAIRLWILLYTPLHYNCRNYDKLDLETTPEKALAKSEVLGSFRRRKISRRCVYCFGDRLVYMFAKNNILIVQQC
mmetsp:Transcript_4960/g.7162  ORF Transcript_4960/g.7162 Transcript_4960/m.7162 type:complete len:89 (+) Transcript_4960:97-363(+)